MGQNLSDSVRRVQSFLSDHGLQTEVRILSSSTRTAAEAADSLECDVAQIAKSLVFMDGESDSVVLVIASGANRVSLEKLRKATGVSLKKADAAFVREQTGYAIGGIPPVTHASEIRTFLDPDLRRFDTIWAAAGTPHAVFRLTPDDLERLTRGRWVELADR